MYQTHSYPFCSFNHDQSFLDLFLEYQIVDNVLYPSYSVFVPSKVKDILKENSPHEMI